MAARGMGRRIRRARFARPQLRDRGRALDRGFQDRTHEGADRDVFLDRERERYAGQLERYAALVRGLDARPIRLGLYHPLLGGWREWAYHG